MKKRVAISLTYTLQKSRQRFEFNDLQAELKTAKDVRDRATAAALGLTPISQNCGGD